MGIELFFSALAGFGYAVAAILSKRALGRGCGILRLSFIMNQIFVVVFALLLPGSAASVAWDQIHLPAITGALFFAGQVFTFAAIRLGDVSLQTPMMGTKAVFVVLLAVLFGTEQVTLELGGAALLAATAVALLGFSGGGVYRAGLSLALALSSSLFFAGSDTMVGTFGREFGPANFLFIAILTNAVLSFGLIPFFHEPLRVIPRPALPWSFFAAVCMAGQALLLNATLANYQNVSAINILYSTRGLWSILLAAPLAVLLSLPRESLTRAMLLQRLIGALLMSAAVGLVFLG
ncbi:MAG: hypothetical protein ACLFUF_04775 [Opitutales bacterium]